MGEASSHEFLKASADSFGGTELEQAIQSTSKSCRAADRRPEGAWGSLPGRSAARICFISDPIKRKRDVFISVALFHLKLEVLLAAGT